MSNINYKQILTYFNQIAYAHEQIRSFGIGDFTQLTNDITTKQEPRYPRLYIIPSNVTFNENQISYDFEVMVYDKVEEDLSNLDEVLSDNLEIITDIWTVFWQSYNCQQGNFSNIVVGNLDPEVTSWTERFETVLAGWTMHLTLVAPFDYNSCVLPIQTGFTFPQDESFSSYYQILQDWKEFANAHEQINSFGFGDETQLTNDILTKVEPLYPRIYFVPNKTRLQSNHMHITFRVIVCDKLEDDLSNQQDVLSDCLEICKDFYAKAYLSDYDLDWNAQLTPWLEETESILAGWVLTVSIQQKFDYNRCVLPIDNLCEGITWEELNELWKLVAQQWAEVKKTE